MRGTALGLALAASVGGAERLAWTLGPEAVIPYPSPGPYQFPDAAFAVLPDVATGGGVTMFWSDGITYRVHGAAPFPNDAPSPPTPVLGPGPNNTYDGNGNWLLAVARVSAADPDALVGFTHVENHVFNCSGPYAEWNSGAVVTSADGGASWVRAGLAVSDAQPCAPRFGGAGYSSVLARGDEPGFRGWGGCNGYETADAAGAPGTWRRYFEGAFSEPGVGGRQSCLPGMPADACCPIVARVPALGADASFVSIFTTWGNASALFITTSADGVAWAPAQVLLTVPPPRTIAYGALHAIDGRNATLVYAAAPPTGGKPRDFVARAITFE
jgi:hypothetical protein